MTVVIIVLLDILAANSIISDLDQIFTENLNERGTFLAIHLAKESGGSLLYEDTGNLNQLAENIKHSDSDVKYVYITDVWNNVIAYAEPADFALPDTDGNSSNEIRNGNVIDFKATINGNRKGFVHVGMDISSIEKKIDKQTDILIFKIFIEGLLGFLIAYFAGNYFTKPIRTLVKGAQEIGKGNLGYKIELDTNDVEMQTLSNAFNQMSYNLEEKEKVEKQLLQADKLATIGELSAGVAHEINNPLGNISLYAQILLNKAEDENTKEKLNVIADEANRAAQIVKGLLDFARQSELKLTPIDVNKEIGKVLSILTPRLKDIKVNTAFEPLPSIIGDSGQIQQVIMNLLSNSIQSLTENGEIIVKTSDKKDHVEIKITDNGCGIPGDNLDKIFDPFFSTKEQGKGTGLGLSISYGIIKRHKGSIEVQSEAGKGTTFTIKLPA